MWPTFEYKVNILGVVGRGGGGGKKICRTLHIATSSIKFNKLTIIAWTENVLSDPWQAVPKAGTSRGFEEPLLN